MATLPDDVKAALDTYSKDMKELVTIQPKQFDVLRVSHMVSEVPPRKWNAAQGVVNATIAKKAADQTLRKTKAQKMLLARHDDSLKAAPDRTAWVDAQDDVQAAEIAAIDAEAELIAARLAYECLDDLFTAGKKIMDYLVKTEEATRQYNRFVDEGRRAK